jgi:integrase
MGLFKRCEHRGRHRDRCDHPWWGAFQHRGQIYRVSLAQWANEDIKTKQQAQAIYENFRQAVRQGRVRSEADPPGSDSTFNAVVDTHVERYVKGRALRTASDIEYRLKPLREFFGGRPIASITTGDVEDFIAHLRAPRRVNRQDAHTLKPASINRNLAMLRRIFNWAIAREYIQQSPFRRGSETLIRLFREDNKRRRRVSEDEEAALLNAAPAMLRAMIICALDTGLRRGEMLALRFGDVDLATGVITIRGDIAKNGKTRQVPITTQRLRAVLEWLRLDAENQSKPDEMWVFSDELGQPVRYFRKGWTTTVLRAHGLKPLWRHDASKPLTPECQAEFRRIDLHWHDLRHHAEPRIMPSPFIHPHS